MNESLRAACRTGITFQCSPDTEDRVPVGGSRLGGRPDLPVDAPWPVARARTFHYELSLPFSFVGQIALADLAAFTDELPHDGLLSFFMLDILRIDGCGGWQGGRLAEGEVATSVTYSASGSPLFRRDPPVDVPTSHRLPVKTMTFGTATTWPQIESNVVSHAEAPRAGTVVLGADEYDAWARDAPDNPRLQLLGHPDGCEFPIDDDPSNRLLLSLEVKSAGLPWEIFGRNGFVFFRITEEALRARRWSEARHKEW